MVIINSTIIAVQQVDDDGLCVDGWSLCDPLFNNQCYITSDRCKHDTYKGFHYGCDRLEHLYQCENYECPHMYKCPLTYCVPLRLVCDGWKDCPDGEDEDHCTDVVCPGLLRCRADDVCVHPLDICDGIVHCLQSRDDESLCDIRDCPDSCLCFGHVLKCEGVLPNAARISPHFIIVIFKQMNINDNPNFKFYKQLKILHIIQCNFTSLDITRTTFLKLFSVRSLKLIKTNIHYLPNYIFSHMTRILKFEIFGNKIMEILEFTFNGLRMVTQLDLSMLHIQKLENRAFFQQSRLLSLNLSNNNLGLLHEEVFSGLLNIKVIDLRRNQLNHIESSTFTTIYGSVLLYFDSPFCCCYGQVDQKCLPTTDDDRVCPHIIPYNWIEMLTLTISVSILCLCVRSIIVHLNQVKSKSYDILLIQLTLSDGMAVLYMLALCVMSNLFDGNYIYLGHDWPDNPICYILRGIVIASIVQSKFTSLQIAIFQLIATRYVFKTQQLLTVRNIQIAVCGSWIMSLIVAVSISLSTKAFDNTCFPLVEISHDVLADNLYTIGILLIMPLLLNILIGGIYFSIFKYVKNSGKKVSTGRRRRMLNKCLLRNIVIVLCIESCCWLSLIAAPLYIYYSNSTHVKLLFVSLICYIPCCLHILHYSGRKFFEINFKSIGLVKK